MLEEVSDFQHDFLTSIEKQSSKENKHGNFGVSILSWLFCLHYSVFAV